MKLSTAAQNSRTPNGTSPRQTVHGLACRHWCSSAGDLLWNIDGPGNLVNGRAMSPS